MKSSALLKLMLLGIPILFLNSCAKQNNDVGNDYYEQCVYVFDKLTNAPLYGADVLFTIATPVNGQVDFPGTTDATGRCCISIPNGSTITNYGVGYFYYEPEYGNGTPASVFLNPTARLTLYIFNSAPKDANDVLTVSYNHPTLGDSLIKIFNGANVDTSMSIFITPGMNTLKWSSTHMGVTTDSTYGPVSMYGNNTIKTIVY